MARIRACTAQHNRFEGYHGANKGGQKNKRDTKWTRKGDFEKKNLGRFRSLVHLESLTGRSPDECTTKLLIVLQGVYIHFKYPVLAVPA